MRRFLLTSEKYDGFVELWYNDIPQLCKIDFTQSSCSGVQVLKIKEAAPTSIENLASSFRSLPVLIVESDFEVSLEDFKREYPYSRNYHLLLARWGKLTKTEQVQAYYAAIEYRKYCKRNDWYKAKIADSWLANKEFLNDWKKM